MNRDKDVGRAQGACGCAHAVARLSETDDIVDLPCTWRRTAALRDRRDDSRRRRFLAAWIVWHPPRQRRGRCSFRILGRARTGSIQRALAPRCSARLAALARSRFVGPSGPSCAGGAARCVRAPLGTPEPHVIDTSIIPTTPHLVASTWLRDGKPMGLADAGLLHAIILPRGARALHAPLRVEAPPGCRPTFANQARAYEELPAATGRAAAAVHSTTTKSTAMDESSAPRLADGDDRRRRSPGAHGSLALNRDRWHEALAVSGKLVRDQGWRSEARRCCTG